MTLGQQTLGNNISTTIDINNCPLSVSPSRIFVFVLFWSGDSEFIYTDLLIYNILELQF